MLTIEEWGMHNEARYFAERLLQHKIGVLTPEIEARLKELSTRQLEEMGIALLDFQSMADLTEWLDTHTEQPAS